MSGTHVVHLLDELALEGPLDACRAAFPERAGTFLLDGGAFTFFGAEPTLSFRAFRTSRRTASGALAGRVVVHRDGGEAVEHEVDDPLEALRALLREHAIDPSVFVGRPIPLLAGAVGYVGYETGQMLERLPAEPRDRVDLPDIALSFHDWVIGRCRRTGRTWLSVVGRGATSGEARHLATRARDHVRDRLAARAVALGGARAAVVPDLHLDATRALDAAGAKETVAPADYLAKIAEAKEHIACGDAFEICLTHRLDAPFAGDPFALFETLRKASPAPYAAFLDLPEAAIVSSSPERFVSLDAEGIAESRPIKGTRPRGHTPDDDERLAKDLATSIKDRAENAMIVDLVRNDLGRVCRMGSVEVPRLYEVERYATVHQLVSTIRGQLDTGRDAIDLVRACFPPGSMTGAPKIEAMTILERLEPTERGPYAGALGWLDFAGTADLSVVIRTVIVKGGVAHLHVGGAIVADSEPSAEHTETLVKARAPLAALAALAPRLAGAAE
ncbi:MAG: aminodeoxychorismate synthase component I [Deltaproteobacteria bacterium]|nr:aminodeoxychorismate synthase component I [Deltaproteobacteria bacterium]